MRVEPIGTPMSMSRGTTPHSDRPPAGGESPRRLTHMRVAPTSALGRTITRAAVPAGGRPAPGGTVPPHEAGRSLVPGSAFRRVYCPRNLEAELVSRFPNGLKGGAICERTQELMPSSSAGRGLAA